MEKLQEGQSEGCIRGGGGAEFVSVDCASASVVRVTFSTVNRLENGRGKPSPLAMRCIEELNENLSEDA